MSQRLKNLRHRYGFGGFNTKNERQGCQTLNEEEGWSKVSRCKRFERSYPLDGLGCWTLALEVHFCKWFAEMKRNRTLSNIFLKLGDG
ncbi:UNVERIFIED_CONTAM: hypothetical protein Sindi_1257800 [Sesamum indicum]